MKKIILKSIPLLAFIAITIFNVQLIKYESDRMISLASLTGIALANGEGGNGNCVPVEIIYQDLFGYYTTQCCQTVYHFYLDRYYCEIGSGCPCPGRTIEESWTYIGTNCCA